MNSEPVGMPRTAEAKDLAVMRRVLKVEANGLEELGRSLDGACVAALDRMAQARGRVTVTGMGKSGHVARKIAATLASLGTPAQFVHPAEASHGDLGMITPGDVVIALSNSGNTPELTDLIAYTRRFAIPLIAMTRGLNSALAEAADVVLLVPASEEACPMGLAPTTSTTAMLALGDALAVALLERRGFSADDFQVFHPGGQLGRRLLRVTDLMHGGDGMPVVAEDALMAEAIVAMSTGRLGCVGVVRDEKLIGIITDGDLRRHMNPRLPEVAVAQVMTPDPRTIRPGALAEEALHEMNSHAITSLFVVDTDHRPLGVIHVHDLLGAGVV